MFGGLWSGWPLARPTWGSCTERTRAAEPRVRVAFTFPPESYPAVTYPAAVLRRAPNPEAAQAFLEFCRSGEALEVFKAAGFQLLGNAVHGRFSRDGWVEGEIREAPLPNPWSAIRLSFLVALAATLAGFVPAVFLGWILARKEFFGKSIVSTLALVPLVLPPVVTGFILLSVFGTQGPLGVLAGQHGPSDSLHPPGGDPGSSGRGPSPLCPIGSECFPGSRSEL